MRRAYNPQCDHYPSRAPRWRGCRARHVRALTRFPGQDVVSAVRIDAARLQQSLEALSVFGRPAGGTFADGVSRVAYSDADVAGRRYAMDLMRAAGLEPRIDAAGNIFGRARRHGPVAARRSSSARTSTRCRAAATSTATSGRCRRSASIAVAARRAACARGIRSRWSSGRTKRACIRPRPRRSRSRRRRQAGRSGRGLERHPRRDAHPPRSAAIPTRLADAQRCRRAAHHCYLELHIEQGGTLERGRHPGRRRRGHRRRSTIRRRSITGFANHAGTTPMAERQDALLAASHLTLAVREVVTREPGRQVGTVGQLDVYAERAECDSRLGASDSIELRDLSPEKLARLGTTIRARARADRRQRRRPTIEFTQIEHDARRRSRRRRSARDRARGRGAAPGDDAACRAAPATTRR